MSALRHATYDGAKKGPGRFNKTTGTDFYFVRILHVEETISIMLFKLRPLVECANNLLRNNAVAESTSWKVLLRVHAASCAASALSKATGSPLSASNFRWLDKPLLASGFQFGQVRFALWSGFASLLVIQVTQRPSLEPRQSK